MKYRQAVAGCALQPTRPKKTGSSMRSQNSANANRSRDKNRPSIEPSSSNISAIKLRARGTPVAAIAHAVQSASSSASQNETGVAPKWNAASNGRESQRKLHCRIAAGDDQDSVATRDERSGHA